MSGFDTGSRPARLRAAAHRRLVRSRGRWGGRFRASLEALFSPLPRVRTSPSRWVPGWAPRLLLVALGIAVMVLLGVGPPSGVLLGCFVLALLLVPSTRTGAAFCVPVAFLWLVLPGDPLSWRSAGLLLLTAAVFELATAIEAVSPLSRVELWALWPSLRRFLVIQLISQPVVLALVALRNSPAHLSAAALPVAVVAAAAVAAGAAWLLPRLGRPPRR
ncbi:hypothetical protein FHX74_002354 [Friedmanniella endophytica]|uniref:Uncharacterized protein n=1 Tax=Microlunatus kandeliicorticis TaxID=1759536 RepID=A0A7W3IT46_9ACTN|nr:hypothetical protein [Microlunatus kandeliicorticis]MBA8794735.1 hypothetical protein [Microlunatus kandeliicorticis]